MSAVLAVAAVFMIGATLLVAQGAGAQTDPYTGGGPTPGGSTIRPGMSISVTEADVDEEVRIQGCLFGSGAFVRITLNPGNAQNPGTPCPGAIGSGVAVGETTDLQLIGVASSRQRVFLQTPTARCPYNNPVKAVPPDTTAGGAIAGTYADNQGCVDVLVRIPNRPPGSYELCTVSTGVETVCAVIRIKAKSSVLGQVFDNEVLGGRAAGEGSSGRAFARTGIILLPLLLLALLAILTGRYLLKRSRARTA